MTSTLNYYKKNLEKFSKETIDLDLSDNWTLFLRHLTNKAKILDAGCGTGRDSDYFIKQGFEVVSIDPVLEFQTKAKKKFGLDILQMSFEDIKWQSTFDAIWASASLLHVPHNNHSVIYETLFDALKPNGVLYCSYKYGEGHTHKDQRDFYSFTEKSFIQFVQSSTDFKIISVKKQQDRRVQRSNEFWLNCLLKKPKT